MKIGIFIGSGHVDPQMGGGYSFQQAILKALDLVESDHQIFLLCNNLVSTSFYNKLSIIPLHKFLSSSSDRFLVRLLRKWQRFCYRRETYKGYKNYLNRAIIEHGIDLVWFISPMSYQEVDVPYVFTIWDLQHRLQPCFPEVSVVGTTYEDREFVFCKALSKASYVLIGNEAGKKELMHFYGLPENRIKINPLPVPDFVFNAPVVQKDIFVEYAIKQPYLFYPAQFWPHKNHVVVVQAIRLLQNKYGKKFDVIFSGSDKGNLDHIKQVVHELGLDGQVHFLGFVDIDLLIALYQNAFALVFASFFGPDNIPPLEAFGFNCPVIASRVSGSECQLEGAALLFDPTSEEELAEKILQLASDVTLRETMIKEGYVRAQKYSSQKYVQNMMNIFDEFEKIRRCWSKQKRYYQP